MVVLTEGTGRGRLTDFPEATFQRNLAGLNWYANHSKSIISQPMLTQVIKSGLAFAIKIQHRDGSFDQAYPFEHSFGATGFLLPDLINAYNGVKSNCTDLENRLFIFGIKKAAEFLSGSSEKHGLISNHLAGAALGLIKAGNLLDEIRFLNKGYALLDHILATQSSEGWFPEYGAADPGYQTLCMTYLAQIYRINPIEELRKALKLSLDFLKYFVHPNGTFGGEYGSRRTEVYYPGGIALLSSEFPDAASMHKFMLSSIEKGNTITLADIDLGNTAPLLNSSILALEINRINKKNSFAAISRN